MTTQTQTRLPTTNGTEATCPECRMNQIEAPFDYCSMCEMLTSYYSEKIATAEQLRDHRLFSEAYEKWRSVLTWAQIETLRDRYWTKSTRARVRIRAKH